MILSSEFLSKRLVAVLNQALLVGGLMLGLVVGGLGTSLLIQRSRLEPIKQSIDARASSFGLPKRLADKSDESIPTGLTAVNLFQTRLSRVAESNGCSVEHFIASDQLGRFVSAYAPATQAQSSLGQIDIKLQLKGSTSTVIQTLKDFHSLGLPYEFNSVELTRTQASPKGVATIRADVSLRLLTKVVAS